MWSSVLTKIDANAGEYLFDQVEDYFLKLVHEIYFHNIFNGISS